MFKLNPDERLLIESGDNHYYLIGPGRVWLMPWQKALTQFSIGPQSQSLQFNEVRTVENIPVNLTTQLLYQVEPSLFEENFLPKIPGLNSGGWTGLLRWRTEHVLRQVVADYSWRDLGRASSQQRLEQQLAQLLAQPLKKVGLKVTSVCLVRTELPDNLQRTIVQAEQDSLEPRGRALVLKEYFDIFGHNLPQAMPYVVQWELLNTLHKNDKTQFVLTSSALSPDGRPPGPDVPHPIFQMQLPLPQENRKAEG
jgi:regulator of protease activity HflC (stomatin/prohibitin superfamily)